MGLDIFDINGRTFSIDFEEIKSFELKPIDSGNVLILYFIDRNKKNEEIEISKEEYKIFHGEYIDFHKDV